MRLDPIFEPLPMRNLRLENRLIRSNLSGRIDDYDGTGSLARIRFEERFAEGGVGAIFSSHVPVHVSGRILPNYAHIDRDDRIPFWRELVRAVHRHGTRFVLQLSHAGRQRDIAGVENAGQLALSSTDRKDPFHGIRCRAMHEGEIRQVIRWFADGARRAREAGVDGVELHAGNGYLFSQFLSSGINDRRDAWGGCLRNRARFLLEVVRAIRAEVGDDFFLCVKYSPVDHHDAITFGEGVGNTLADGVQVGRWLEEEGVDALHVTTGNLFPHPRNPPGEFAFEEARKSYRAMLGEGTLTWRNWLLFKYGEPLFRRIWKRAAGDVVEGVNLPDAAAVRRAVRIPVICTGGFQDGELIRRSLLDGSCDAVSIGRPLLANPDLPRMLARGEAPARPCTFCNRCLVNVLEHPLGCYEVERFDGDHAAMMREVLAFYGEEAPRVARRVA